MTEFMPNRNEEEQIQKTLTLVRKDIIYLVTKEPFFGYLLADAKKIISTKVAVTDAKIDEDGLNLYIHPKNYAKYSREERIFMLLKEIVHIIHLHFTRMETRDPDTWVMASELAVYQLIEFEPKSSLKNENRMRVTAPIDTLRITSWEEQLGVTLPPKLHAEAYYEWLKKFAEEQKKPMPMPDHMKDTPTGNHLEEQAKEQKSSSEESSSSESVPFQDLHPLWKEDEDYSEDIQKSVLKEMLKETQKRAGEAVPTYLKSVIQDMLEPQIDWVTVFRNFIASQRNMLKKATWKKRNRRLGTKVMGYKKLPKLTVLVAIDTSASVTEKEFALFIAEIERMAQRQTTILLVECDTKIQKGPYKFEKGSSYTFSGRGGTDFRPVFALVQSNSHPLLRQKPDVLVFLTDGHGPAPKTATIPTLWCLTPNSRKPYVLGETKDIEWGTFLTLKE